MLQMVPSHQSIARVGDISSIHSTRRIRDRVRIRVLCVLKFLSLKFDLTFLQASNPNYPKKKKKKTTAVKSNKDRNKNSPTRKIRIKR